MKATMKKEVLQTIYNASQAIKASDIPVFCSPGGWEIRMMDPANVAMVSMDVTADAFLAYDMEDCRFCIPSAKLKSMLSVMGDDVEMSMLEGRITMKSGSIRRSTLSEAIDGNQRNIPSLELDNEARVDTADLRKMLSTCGEFTDHVEVSMGPDGLTVTAQGDVDELTWNEPQAKSANGDVQSAGFTLDYLNDALRNLPSSVTLRMRADYPLMLESNEPFHLVYILAPRIESD